MTGQEIYDGAPITAGEDEAAIGMIEVAPPVLPEETAEESALKPPGAATHKLFPAVDPYHTGQLKVSDVHTLYYEQSGNPDGKAALFLHGGPGGGTSAANRRFFDPAFYRIILVDQRGSGKSTPHASLDENTTWHLVEDLERLRRELNIDTWLVFGGSWGSTLSLAYAQTHPTKVDALVLRGIFMLRKKEIRWFYQEGADVIFPDAWESYRDFIPEAERADFVAAYNKRLMDEADPALQLAAAKAWTGWEMQTSYLVQNEDSLKRGENDKFALAFARIENHYFVNKGFFDSDQQLLENVPKIRHIPAVIIQGRYDVVCPFMSAWDLHRAWPEADFKVVPDAGHSANEPGITSELVAATEKFKAMFAANNH